MQTSNLILCIAIICVVAFFLGSKRSRIVANKVGGIKNLHSLPSYYGALTALWCAIPALIVVALWTAFEPSVLNNALVNHLPAKYQNLPEEQLSLVANNVRNLANGSISTDNSPEIQAAANEYKRVKNISAMGMTALGFCAALAGLAFLFLKIKPELRARQGVERIIKIFLIACSSLAILTTFGIVMSVLFESVRFFQCVPFFDFVFGTHWSPQNAHSCGPEVSKAFGAIPLFVGTLLISLIALLIAVPIGLMSAIYLSEYASSKMRSIAKPILEILAGVPTVVYGFFAALTIAPMLRWAGEEKISPFFVKLNESFAFSVSSESALAAGLVMGVMIIPFVSSLSDDVINAVPQSLRDGALGLGATKSETIRNVVIPAALPGIVGGVLLAASRAIGETMIVVMAAGLAAKLTANPLDSVTTVTVQIVTLLTGDQEFDSPKTLAAFALGLMLFVVTLILNVIALRVVRKYREQYD